jgi:hypothetical protein
MFYERCLSWEPYGTHRYSPYLTENISATETNRLMLFGETVAVYRENNTEHTDTVCEYNTDVLWTYRCALSSTQITCNVSWWNWECRVEEAVSWSCSSAKMAKHFVPRNGSFKNIHIYPRSNYLCRQLAAGLIRWRIRGLITVSPLLLLCVRDRLPVASWSPSLQPE